MLTIENWEGGRIDRERSASVDGGTGNLGNSHQENIKILLSIAIANVETKGRRNYHLAMFEFL